MGKATKAMKAVAMKAMKKTVSKIAKGARARASVFRGGKEKTSGGLKKSDIVKSKSGKLVSKKAYKRIQGWTVAVQKAKKALGLTGFVAVKKGSALYKKAKECYTK